MPQFFAAAPKGVEELLAEELSNLGAEHAKPAVAGVRFESSWETAYLILLWSRIASRVLHPIAEFTAVNPDQLYKETKRIDWDSHLNARSTFAVDAAVRSAKITHSKFAALKVKDAIADYFRDRTGRRPSVDRGQPDLQLSLFVKGDRGTLSVDLGGPLHLRGYRREGGQAPLKENLAAAILTRAQWPEIAAEGGDFVDPMCGSGTLLIEAAMIAADIAPGLQRGYMGMLGWRQFQAKLWRSLVAEAEKRRDEGLARDRRPRVHGCDLDPRILEIARRNVDRAGLGSFIELDQRALADWRPEHTRDWRPGLAASNPPYGERLGQEVELAGLYASLGATLRSVFGGWRGAILTGAPELFKQTGIRAERRNHFYNGPLSCTLLRFSVWAERPEQEAKRALLPLAAGGAVPISEGAAMFRNRLEKNLKTLLPWAAKEGLACFRVYDADMPEYNAAIDVYSEHVAIQEYQAPRDIPEADAKRRLYDILLVAPEILGAPRDQVALKQRKKQKGDSQYERLDKSGQFLEVGEYGLRFLVNLRDYLDTGLFLDHRLTRRLVRESAAGKRFLNLFAYTGAATVYAAAGGAASTLTIDMSANYLDWAKRNMALNGFEGRAHRFIHADCVKWLSQARGEYDLIFLDPPTFSNSKRMEHAVDIQRDHVKLLAWAGRLLARDGVLLFSTNFRRFKLDAEALANLGLSAEDISQQTIPLDFARNPRIHYCWKIVKTGPSPDAGGTKGMPRLKRRQPPKPRQHKG